MTLRLNKVEKLESLIAFIRDAGCKVHVKQNLKRKDGPDGSYDRNITRIDIICSDRIAEAEELTAFLIHEYGHYICTEEMGHVHYCPFECDVVREENRAWVTGRKNVPARLVPKCYKEIKKMAMTSYKKYYDRKNARRRRMDARFNPKKG